MKYLVGLVVVFILAFSIKKLNAFRMAQQSCFQNIDNENFKKIEKSGDAIILDVRTKAEFNAGNIKNAINIDVTDISFATKINELDKSKKYLVYCRSGARSLRACSAMCDAGFKEVFNLSNGFMGWSE